MRIVGQLPSSRVTQAPRHPEVNQEYATAFEPKNQILAATLDRLDPLTLEVRRDRARLERPGQPFVEDVDPLERAAGEGWGEPAANSLDLGQLGHACSLARAGLD